MKAERVQLRHSLLFKASVMPRAHKRKKRITGNSLFSLRLCWFPLGLSASSPSPKTCTLGRDWMLSRGTRAVSGARDPSIIRPHLPASVCEGTAFALQPTGSLSGVNSCPALRLLAQAPATPMTLIRDQRQSCLHSSSGLSGNFV